MNGRTSWVVVENRGALGLAIIRHPYSTFELAQARAVEEAHKQPGTTFYIGELQMKFKGTVEVKGALLD